MHMRGEPRTMQADPRYDDVVPRWKAFLEEGLAFAVAAGNPRGARLPRPGHRLRKDGRAQLRARAAPRRARRDRAPGGRRLLAEEHARPDPRRPGRRDRDRVASVGAAVAAYERGATILRVHDVREHVEALARRARRSSGRERRSCSRARALRLPRRPRGGARAGQTFLYDVELEVGEPRRRRPARERGRLPQGRGGGARGRRARRTTLLEALACAIADALSSVPARARSKVRVRKPDVRPGGIDVEFAARRRSSGRDVAPTSASARTSATARRRSGGRRS